MNIKWNAQGYTDDFQFVHKYGEDVLELLDVADNSLVIDLGCGNGALTKKLSEKGYRVIGIDASKEMIDIAKNKHPDLDISYGDAVTFNLEEKADAVFSNAVFHWIDNQDGLIRNIAYQLKQGGQLVCE
jgi:trans-aconitate methyltransferase